MVELVTIVLAVLTLDIIITSLLSIVLYQRYQATKIKAVLLAVLFFALDAILGLVELGFVLSNSGDLSTIYMDNQPFPIFFSILGILGAGTFLLFINYYLREEISLAHVAVIFSVLFTFLTYSFMNVYLNYHDITYPSLSVTNTPISFEFLPAILITYLLIVTYPQLIRLFRTTKSPRQRSVVLGLLVGLFFYYVNTSVLITLSNQLDFEGDMFIIISSVAPRASVIIGDFIILFTYARIPAAYLHDQEIEKLLIISKSGLLVYSQDFNDVNTQSDGDVLLSGGLSALSSMLAETIEVSELESIEFKEKDVLIEQGPTVGFFLITNRPSRFLWNALSNIGNLFNDIADLQNQESFNQEIRQEEKIVTQVNQIFGI